MRSVFAVLITTLAIASCKQDSGGIFTVEGNIKNTDASKVYLQEISLENGIPKTVDSAEVKDGIFKIESKAKEERLYYLQFNDYPRPFATFINDANRIKISGDMQAPLEFKFEGSKASMAMKDFYNGINKKWQALGERGRTIDSLKTANAADSLVAKADNEAEAVAADIKNDVKGIVVNGKSPALAYLAIQVNQNLYMPDEFSNMLRLASETYPEHTGLKSVQSTFEKQLAAASQMKQHSRWEGKKAPEISLPDVNGKTVKLSSFKGKYVLVDFWASWCKPCRLENPNVVAAYKNFKEKNFTVLGVSLDDDKKAWLKAIEKDGLTWTHISDLKHWESLVVPLYNIRGIPFNVLIDPAGTIVAEDLRGPQLQAKLQEILN